MNISKIFTKKESDSLYANSFKRALASMIDMIFTLFLRGFIMQILGTFWMNKKILQFQQEFETKFGTETMKNTPDHINYFISHGIIFHLLAFYLIILMIGATYHAYFNSSKWQATIGKRIMKIIIIEENENNLFKRISLKKAFIHYFLSILPFAFVIYIIFYQISHNMSLLQSLTASELNSFLGISFMLWVQIQLFTKKKVTAYDMICKTNLVNGRTEDKKPW